MRESSKDTFAVRRASMFHPEYLFGSMKKNSTSPFVSSFAHETPTVAFWSVELNEALVRRTSMSSKPSLASSASRTSSRLPPSSLYATVRCGLASLSFWTAAAREPASITGLAETRPFAESPLAATTLRYLPAAASGTWMLGPATSSFSHASSAASAESAAYQESSTSLVTSMP